MQIWSKYFDGSVSAAYEFLSPLDQETPGALMRLKNYTEQFAAFQYDTPAVTSMGVWCSWIPICMAIYCISRKKWGEVVALAPSFATLLSLIVGPMVLYWYGIPMYYIAFLSIGIAASPSFGGKDRLLVVHVGDSPVGNKSAALKGQLRPEAFWDVTSTGRGGSSSQQ